MKPDRELNINLTTSDMVLLREALRLYVENIHELVHDALNASNYPAACVHEQRIAQAIAVFGKIGKEN